MHVLFLCMTLFLPHGAEQSDQSDHIAQPPSTELGKQQCQGKYYPDQKNNFVSMNFTVKHYLSSIS